MIFLATGNLDCVSFSLHGLLTSEPQCHDSTALMLPRVDAPPHRKIARVAFLLESCRLRMSTKRLKPVTDLQDACHLYEKEGGRGNPFVEMEKEFDELRAPAKRVNPN